MTHPVNIFENWFPWSSSFAFYGERVNFDYDIFCFNSFMIAYILRSLCSYLFIFSSAFYSYFWSCLSLCVSSFFTVFLVLDSSPFWFFIFESNSLTCSWSFLFSFFCSWMLLLSFYIFCFKLLMESSCSFIADLYWETLHSEYYSYFRVSSNLAWSSEFYCVLLESFC